MTVEIRGTCPLVPGRGSNSIAYEMLRTGASAPLVGRSEEVSRLHGLADDPPGGSARIAVVEGEAGIGKTRLITEALALAEASGFTILRGMAHELEQHRHFAPLIEAFEIDRRTHDPQQAELTRLLRRPAGRPPRTRDLPAPLDPGFLIMEATLSELEELASNAPVILALEDLQWADSDTLRALRFIARHLTDLRVALWVSLRPMPHRPELDRVIEGLLDQGALHIRLGRLTGDEAAELAGRIAGATVGPRLRHQVDGAAGNPLFVIELVKALEDEGAIDVQGGHAEIGDESLPPTLRLTLLRRLSFLATPTLEALKLASILGTSFSLSDLSAITGRSAIELFAALEGALQAGLLGESGERLSFRHDLVREAIYSDMPLAVRKEFHREAGWALARAGASVEHIADHVILGAELGDMKAIGWLRDSAEGIARPSPAAAVRLLEQALRLTSDEVERRDAIAGQLIEPLLWIGRLHDAEAIARDVLTRAQTHEIESMLRAGLAGALSMAGRYPEALEQLEITARITPSEFERESLLAAAAYLQLLGGGVDEAQAAAERAVDNGKRLGNDQALCIGLQTLALAAAAQGFVARELTLAKEAVAVADRADLAWANYVFPHFWYGIALFDADRIREAEEMFHAGRRRAEQMGNIAHLSLYHWILADIRTATGNWDDGLAEAKAGLALVEETGNRVGDVFAHALRAWVAFHRAELRSATTSLNKAESMLAAGEVQFGYDWMMWVRALLLEKQGKLQQSMSVLERAWEAVGPLRYLLAASRFMAPDLVRLALKTDKRERAVAVTEEIERSARRAETHTASGVAFRCRGLVDDDLEAHLEAVSALRMGIRPHELALACEDAGVALSRAGRRGEGISLLTEALQIQEHLRAAHDASRVISSLRALGAPPRTKREPKPSIGWASLTKTELEVVKLVAEGLTNRQVGERLFVSRRTVATHLEHVFQKLGLSTRVQVATEVSRRTVTGPANPEARTMP